ncbi:MAG: 5-methyltetrahydropteroyltriglutamate--homocysteine S-methyltransferase [Thalassolituus sp.]
MTYFHVPGFPRIGEQRELKWALEKYWREEISETELQTIASDIKRGHWQAQIDVGCDLITVGDFCLYDHVLNASYLFNHLPRRVKTTERAIDQCFLAARGRAPTGQPVHACDMSKWFDTNYHYIVPEIHAEDSFSLQPDFLLKDIREAKELNQPIKVVLPGPVTYLRLADSKDGTDPLVHIDALTNTYGELISLLKKEGVEWVQLDEPVLATDLPEDWLQALERAYHQLNTPGINILLATYFGAAGENTSRIFSLPVQGIHLDLVEAPAQLTAAIDNIGPYKILSAGVIDGRNIWRTDLNTVYQALRPIHQRLGERLWISPSCSLLHVPYSAVNESGLESGCEYWLAFAAEKLHEGRLLKQALGDPSFIASADWLDQTQRVISRRTSERVHNSAVKARADVIAAGDWYRATPFEERLEVQQTALNLPLFPTTTIGSFPQTDAIRAVRKQWREGEITPEQYEQALKQEIEFCVREQEEIGLDVLVHGEAERTDMVEYFGALLKGIAVTANGWVQSYGSRCVKPPIIYGDIERQQALTVSWSTYAQSLTEKPMKGMLTGPVTILKWAFVRDDQPRSATTYQLAAVLNDEVRELEANGINIIQIDEPALREGLPLKKSARGEYIRWATSAFRYCYEGVSDSTQIHTHMCYADFDDILDAIEALDADVITLETARSASALLSTLKTQPYPNGIGPGVYDIHSPNIPEQSHVLNILNGALESTPAAHLWVNPDCGLKTRRWEEVTPALKAMVAAAEWIRTEDNQASAVKNRQGDVSLH